MEIAKRGSKERDYLSGWFRMFSDVQKIDLNYTTEFDTSNVLCFWPLRGTKDED